MVAPDKVKIGRGQYGNWMKLEKTRRVRKVFLTNLEMASLK